MLQQSMHFQNMDVAPAFARRSFAVFANANANASGWHLATIADRATAAYGIKRHLSALAEPPIG